MGWSPSHLIALLLPFNWVHIITEAASPLTVDPSFLLIPEDWSLSEPLPLSLCPSPVSILSGNIASQFSVVPLNSSCSTLKLNSPLDADKISVDGLRGQSFSLVLAGKRRARATLELQVVDVNDNAPEFVAPPSVITIPEDTVAGTVVAKIRTRDVDTGIAGMARYSVEDDHFSMDRRECGNGECWSTMRLQKMLDFESQRIHHVVVVAEDGDPHQNMTNRAELTIIVHVTDVPDSGPRWLSDLSQSIHVDSSAVVGDELMVLKAERTDGKQKDAESPMRYSIHDNDYLAVDASTGSVTLKKTPAGAMELVVKVTATESGESGMSVSGQLRMKSAGATTTPPTSQVVGDICESVITEATIREGSNRFEGNPLLVRFTRPVSASDAFIEGGRGAFAISTNQSDANTIGVVVHQADAIDYEKEKTIQLTVSTGSGRCRVDIRVLDENDNSPRFSHDSFLFYVTENHRPTVLGKVTATDDDSEEYQPISYSILGEGAKLFSISESGEMRSLLPIDREQHDRFDLVVRATDAGGKWTDCPGKVVVRDINDNSPVFEKELYEIELDEEKSLKQRIVATDADLGENAQISYSVEEVPEGMPIDMSAGILYIGKLDRDTMDSDRVNLVIRATDHGEPPRSTTTNMTIIVKDINDNYPVFSNSLYSLVLDANISPGGIIGAVKAEDADATSPNNYVRYSADDGRFKISDNGEIVYTGEGVLERESSLEFVVTAMDGGEPTRNASSRVVINEHRGALQSRLTTRLNGTEESQRVEVKWANSGMAGYTYELVRAVADGFKESEVKKWVEIDEKTGAIHTIRKLSPDSVKRIRLYISMTKGKREVPVELIINVVDNDSTPYFKKDSHEAKVPEDLPEGSKVVRVKASGDAQDTYKYSLKFVQGSAQDLVIDNQGWITTNRRLDFETTRLYSGLVVASDLLGNSARANFTIQVTDVNDNRPVFKNGSVFSVEMDESAPVGTRLDLPYPLATDEDSGESGRLNYTLVGGDGWFEIDQSSSVILLSSPLDYESQRVHSLSIRCSDSGSPPQRVFASITVTVRDINDNEPVIHNADLLHLTVSEDAAAGTVVTVLSVTDADEDGHQAVSLDANHSLFRIDSSSSRLLVDKSLNGFAGERICSSILASDGRASTSAAATFPYCVTVYPATNNHHNPLIVSPKPNSIHYFDENTKYDELLRIKLLDEGIDMANITFRLDTTFKNDWELFSINSSGSLSAKAPFDFERRNLHELRVEACRVSNCSSVHIFISVNDRNDNCPIFPKQEVSLSLVENDKSAVPRLVGRVPAALDADFHADNTKVCYSTDSPLFFFLDPSLPVLYTNNSFDREQKKEHRVMIVAYDCLLSCMDPHKPMNSSLSVTVNVTDVNDNFPRFAEKVFKATIIQGHASGGNHLTTLLASDEDEEKEGLKYSIKGVVRAGKQTYSSAQSPIEVDSSTGEVSARESLRDPFYSFTVAVTDAVGHEDTAVVEVSVVTYGQQAELLFDAPFDFIVRNEKHIVSLLSQATSFNAVVDRCRQNANLTLVLAHFSDNAGQFVDVETAIQALTISNGTARRELRSAYGMRDAVAPRPTNHASIDMLAIGAAVALLILLLIIVCICCRQKNTYDAKLRQISVHAAAHHATLGRPVKKMTPSFYVDGSAPIMAGSARMMAPPPPLQSTEL